MNPVSVINSVNVIQGSRRIGGVLEHLEADHAIEKAIGFFSETRHERVVGLHLREPGLDEELGERAVAAAIIEQCAAGLAWESNRVTSSALCLGRAPGSRDRSADTYRCRHVFEILFREMVEAVVKMNRHSGQRW